MATGADSYLQPGPGAADGQVADGYTSMLPACRTLIACCSVALWHDVTVQQKSAIGCKKAFLFWLFE